MPRGKLPLHSDAEFTRAWYEAGCSPLGVAKLLGITERCVYQRRDRMAAAGFLLASEPTGNAPAQYAAFKTAYPREKQAELRDGVILVGSDAHIWPGPYTVAMQAFLNIIPIVKPSIIVANGDFFDGARTSRHPRIGWARTPTQREERLAVKAFTDDIEKAAFAENLQCALEWNVGNHCLRYDNYLSRQAPEIEGEPMTRLEDHFPRWSFQWSLLVNPSAHIPAMIKHRFANGGVNAGYNATLKSGFHTVNGHTHNLSVTPWSDYRGRRYGVQGGGLLDMHAPAVEYHENNPSPACSGFAVLTFRDGEMLPPELCEVINGRAIFRREIIA